MYSRQRIECTAFVRQCTNCCDDVVWSNIKSWRTVVVGKYSKCHNSLAGTGRMRYHEESTQTTVVGRWRSQNEHQRPSHRSIDGNDQRRCHPKAVRGRDPIGRRQPNMHSTDNMACLKIISTKLGRCSLYFATLASSLVLEIKGQGHKFSVSLEYALFWLYFI